MKLLIEELFEKINQQAENSIVFKVLVRITTVIIVITILGIVAWAILKGEYFIILIILGVFIVAETAHSIRKLMEGSLRKDKSNKLPSSQNAKTNITKMVAKKTETKKSKHRPDLEVDGSLLDEEKSKNKSLLKEAKSNESLLKKKAKKIKVDSSLLSPEKSKNNSLINNGDLTDKIPKKPKKFKT